MKDYFDSLDQKVYVLFNGGTTDGAVLGVYATKEAALRDLVAHKKLMKKARMLTVTEYILRS